MSSKFYLKSSSLSNTIFICVIISVLCGCLVLISHYQNLLIDRLEFNEALVNTNNASFNYFLANYNKLNNETNDLDIFNNGITTIGSKKKWGFYDILVSKTVFKNDTIIKSALLGKSSNPMNRLALYVTDYDKSLKLSGKSVIKGDVKVPKGNIERGQINNKTKTSININGERMKSEDAIPKIENALDFDLFSSEMLTLEYFDNNPIFNDFGKQSLIIDVSGNASIENLDLKGNIILFSRNPLKIGSSNTIEDILVVAPTLVIASGFVGNMQIISKENVEVDTNVLLKYPSCIYVENDIDSVTVTVKENAKIAGGIVVNGNTYNGALKRRLIIEPKAQITGDVYCYGKTQLEGEITGTIYTDRFVLKTKSSEYENVIQNCNINRDSLPENFVRLSLFNNQDATYEVVKTF